jgi:hypothetical protein
MVAALERHAVQFLHYVNLTQSNVAEYDERGEDGSRRSRM